MRRDANAAWESLSPEAAHDYRLSWRAAVVVVLFAASLLYLKLGSTRALTYHEVLFAQPAKEMVASGDWLLPRFAGLPSTHKPPGAHWAIAVMMTLTGSQSEAVVRFPAATAGVLTALLAAVLAARWFGGRIGLLAGLMQATVYHVLQLARLGECDSLLTLAVSCALGCFAVATIESPRGLARGRWLPWLFFLSAGAAYLFKGLIGPAFIFSCCGAFVMVRRDWQVLRFLISPIGWLIFAACTIGWFAPAVLAHPPLLEDQLWHHFGRFQGEMGGGKPALFYVYSVMLNVLPWTPLALLAWARVARSGLWRQPLWQFFACWTLPGLMLLQMSAFKSRHYAAPLMPPLTMAAALGLSDYLRWRLRLPAWAQLASGLASAGACGLAAGLLLHIAPPKAELIAGLLLSLGVGIVLLHMVEFRNWTVAQPAVVFGATWVLVASVLCYVMPAHDSYRDQQQLAQRINQQQPAEQPIYLLQLPENQITYYLHAATRRIDDPPIASRRFFDQAATVRLLAPEFLADELTMLGELRVLDRCASVNRYRREDQRLTYFELRQIPLVASQPRAAD